MVVSRTSRAASLGREAGALVRFCPAGAISRPGFFFVPLLARLSTKAALAALIPVTATGGRDERATKRIST
jgi:hypothetical protein